MSSASPISSMGVLQNTPLSPAAEKKRKRAEMEDIIRAGIFSTTLESRIKATKDKKYKLTQEELAKVDEQVKTRLK